MQVEFSRKAKKDLDKAPRSIQRKVEFWLDDVLSIGIQKTRIKTGWNDHSLAGNRKGQRSIYLNKSWRLIYAEAQYDFIIIIEIHKHNY